MARITDVSRVDHSSIEIQLKHSSGGPNQQSKNLGDICYINGIVNDNQVHSCIDNVSLKSLEVISTSFQILRKSCMKKKRRQEWRYLNPSFKTK